MSVLPLYSERFGVQRFCFAPGANVDNPVLGRSGIGVGDGFIHPTVNGLVSPFGEQALAGSGPWPHAGLRTAHPTHGE